MFRPDPKPSSTTSPVSPTQTRSRSSFAGPTAQATLTIRGSTCSPYTPIGPPLSRSSQPRSAASYQPFEGGQREDRARLVRQPPQTAVRGGVGEQLERVGQLGRRLRR